MCQKQMSKEIADRCAAVRNLHDKCSETFSPRRLWLAQEPTDSVFHLPVPRGIQIRFASKSSNTAAFLVSRRESYLLAIKSTQTKSHWSSH